MKRFILATLLMLTTTVSFGCELSDTRGLPKEAVAQLKVACEQAKLDAMEAAKHDQTLPKEVTNLTPEKISAIGATAQEIAKAIGAAAKELGVAANEFLLTPAGILVVVGIFWKLFLVQTVGLIGAVFTIFACIWFVRRALVAEYVVVEKRRFWGWYTVTVNQPHYTPFSKLKNNQGWTIFCTVVFTLALEAICVFGLL